MPASGGESVSISLSAPGSDTAAFGRIDFTQPGTYTYTVTETAPAAADKTPGLAYDSSVYTVNVTVSAEAATGALSAAVTEILKDGQTAADVEFTNVFTPKQVSISVKKTLTGPVPSGTSMSFGFAMERVTGGAPMPDPATVQIDLAGDGFGSAEGTASFEAITFDRPGDFTYRVTEVVYTTDYYTVVVSVTDNGDGTMTAEPAYYKNGGTASSSAIVFENTYETVTKDGEKTWEDFNNAYLTRPSSITVNLLRKIAGAAGDPQQIDTQTVSADAEGRWTWSFTGLPKYAPGATTANKNEKEYEYSVEEIVVSHCSWEIWQSARRCRTETRRWNSASPSPRRKTASG